MSRTSTRAAVLAALLAVFALAGCNTPGSPTGTAGPSDGTGVLGEPTAPPTNPEESSTKLYGFGLDVVELATVGDYTLRTTEGWTFPIPRGTRYAVRIPIGWLYGQAQGPVSLLTPTGASLELAASLNQDTLEMPGTPVLSADGSRIAWAGAGTVHTGRITVEGIQDVVTSPVGDDVYPLLWAGSRVVLGHSYGTGCCSSRPAEYDIWDPAAGDFAPSWSRGLRPIYGPVPDGGGLFGMSELDRNSPTGCLVRLDAVKDLSATETTCMVGDSAGLHSGSLSGLLSPDGRHLVELLDEELVMLDLSTGLDGIEVLRSCEGHYFPVAWEDERTVLLSGSGPGLYRCSADGAPVEQIAAVEVEHYVVPRIG